MTLIYCKKCEDDSRRKVQPGCIEPNSKGQCYVGMPEDEEEGESDTDSTTNCEDEFLSSGEFFD